MTAPQLSVIIPALDEEAALRILLPQLQAQQNLDLEIILADGGSSDSSIEVARRFGARVVVCERGRARQMNHGARMAGAACLLFLHADSQLTRSDQLQLAWNAWRAESARRPWVAGHFGLQFERSGPAHSIAFRFLEEKSRCGRRLTINGDQGLLIGRDWFETLGGFDETMPFFEDQVMAERIFREGRWMLLPGTLKTSGRRFETEGFHRRYILMSLIMGLYWSDVRIFFARARGVYQAQADTSRLLLWPFFAAIWRMQIDDLGWKASLQAWLRVGRFVRGNSWQMFFWIDVLCRRWLGPGAYPFTRFHDRFFRPLTDHRLADWLTSVLVFVWYMLCLGPYFLLADRLGANGRAGA